MIRNVRRAGWFEVPLAPPSPRVRSGEARILVAEDDAELREVVVESLRKDGHDVVDVEDGDQLLARLARHHPLRSDPEPIDLIVTDMRMPIVSGLEVVQILRDAEWRTPVVIMTGFADEETRRRARQLDALVLDKPVRMTVLRGRVTELLLTSHTRGLATS